MSSLEERNAAALRETIAIFQKDIVKLRGELAALRRAILTMNERVQAIENQHENEAIKRLGAGPTHGN